VPIGAVLNDFITGNMQVVASGYEKDPIARG